MKKTLFILILYTTYCFSQSGSLDLSFNPNDIGNGMGYGPNGYVKKMAVQQDGKIIILGSFTTINGIPRFGLARLNPDATLDTSFDIGINSISNTYYNSTNGLGDLAIQSDGKIIIAGAFTSCRGYAANNIVRLNPDGTVDTSFVNIFGTSDIIYKIHIQADDKILVSGEFTAFFGNLRIKIARLLADGNLDMGFNTGSGINGSVLKFIEQPDGKILIGGGFTAIQGYARGNIGRFNTDGSVDLSFASSGANATVNDMALQNDGKIVIAGGFTAINSIPRKRCARLDANGILDTTFQNPNISDNDYVTTLQLLNDGRIIVGGTFNSVNNIKTGHLVCLNADGSPNTSSLSPFGTTETVSCSKIQPDGKLLIGGAFLGYGYSGNASIVRINTDGTFDNSFVFNGTGANSDVFVTQSQSDGKILVGGNFTKYNNVNAFKLTRTNADGSHDTTFSGYQGISHNADEPKINAIKLQTDGKILIGGYFNTVNGNTSYAVARLNPDGSSDTTFTSPFVYGDEVKSIYIQPDGKILVGTYGNIKRLNPNGTFDSSFHSTPTNGYISDINIDSNGKIIISGGFTYYGSGYCPKTARLNADGTPDYSFHGNVIPNGFINKVLLLPNDKLFIAGTFSLYSGTTVYDMAVLNSDSSLSSSFSSGVGVTGGATFSYQVFDAALQPNGKIIIVGNFTSYNGTTQNRIARINQDGSLDTTFNMGGTGFDGKVTSCKLTPDEKIIVGGSFTSYNGIGRNRIARINNDGSLADADFSENDVSVYPNPFQNILYVDNPDRLINKYELYDLIGHKIQGQSLGSNEIKTENLAKGIYLLKLYTDKGFTLKKIIRE
jgi:uncharacterized delta-60 repeat protein